MDRVRVRVRVRVKVRVRVRVKNKKIIVLLSAMRFVTVKAVHRLD